MTLPSDVEQAIEKAYHEMLKDVHHNLHLKQRLYIYKAITVTAGFKAKKIRGWLALLTAKLVLPIWEKEKPDDKLPRTLLQVAENFLLNNISLEEIDKDYNLKSIVAGGLYVNWDISTEADYSLDAIVTALAEILGIVLNSEQTQRQIEWEIEQGFPDEMMIRLYVDTALVTVCAYSGISFDWDALNIKQLNAISDSEEIIAYVKTSFNPNFNPTKRLEFWEWWLTKAIPQAWELAQQSTSS